MTVENLLLETQSKFQALQAKGKRYNYPAALREAALRLLADYSPTELSKLLGISSKCLQNWQSDKLQQKPAEFMALDVPGLLSNNESYAASELILQLPHQISLVLPKQPISETVALICGLIKEFKRCSI